MQNKIRNVHYLAATDSVLQQFDHILSLDACTLKSLGPANKPTYGQALLFAGEREGESKGQFTFRQVVLFDELLQALRQVVEQLPVTHSVHYIQLLLENTLDRYLNCLSNIPIDINPLTTTVAIRVDTTIKHPVPDRVKPAFVIFDILTL